MIRLQARRLGAHQKIIADRKASTAASSLLRPTDYDGIVIPPAGQFAPSSALPKFVAKPRAGARTSNAGGRDRSGLPQTGGREAAARGRNQQNTSRPGQRRGRTDADESVVSAFTGPDTDLFDPSPIPTHIPPVRDLSFLLSPPAPISEPTIHLMNRRYSAAPLVKGESRIRRMARERKRSLVVGLVLAFHRLVASCGSTSGAELKDIVSPLRPSSIISTLPRQISFRHQRRMQEKIKRAVEVVAGDYTSYTYNPGTGVLMSEAKKNAVKVLERNGSLGAEAKRSVVGILEKLGV